MQALQKVVQTGSFTQAAEALGTNKSMVSRAISRLERRLGVHILQRSTRWLSLTDSGREIHQRIERILAQMDEVKAFASQSQLAPSGALHISCGVDFGHIQANQWVSGFMQAYPDVRVNVEYSNRLVDLAQEGFDLAIRVGHLSDSSLQARRLMQIDYGLYAAPRYVAQHGAPMRPKDLIESHDLIMFENSKGEFKWTLHQREVVFEVKPRSPPKLLINHTVAACSAAVQGLGIVRLPRSLAQAHLESGALTQVLPDWRFAATPVHAVYSQTAFVPPNVRAFIDFVVQQDKRH